jgi:hypothetical protein
VISGTLANALLMGYSPSALTMTSAVSATVYDERELIDFAWRCPNDHLFATAIGDIPLGTWRRLNERP